MEKRHESKPNVNLEILGQLSLADEVAIYFVVKNRVTDLSYKMEVSKGTPVGLVNIAEKIKWEDDLVRLIGIMDLLEKRFSGFIDKLFPEEQANAPDKPVKRKKSSGPDF